MFSVTKIIVSGDAKMFEIFVLLQGSELNQNYSFLKYNIVRKGKPIALVHFPLNPSHN